MEDFRNIIDRVEAAEANFKSLQTEVQTLRVENAFLKRGNTTLKDVNQALRSKDEHTTVQELTKIIQTLNDDTQKLETEIKTLALTSSFKEVIAGKQASITPVHHNWSGFGRTASLPIRQASTPALSAPVGANSVSVLTQPMPNDQVTAWSWMNHFASAFSPHTTTSPFPSAQHPLTISSPPRISTPNPAGLLQAGSPTNPMSTLLLNVNIWHQCPGTKKATFVPYAEKDQAAAQTIYYQCITFMGGLSAFSLEELRLVDAGEAEEL